MIKANELRIGNYYDQFGNIHQVNGHTISELEKAPESQLWCKPIPLTEEWLLKFGFIKTSEYEFYFWQNSIWKLKEYKNKRYYELYHYSDEVDCTMIKYVNQLQNLYFALTGEELTIESNEVR
jgi:hypothetical protein